MRTYFASRSEVAESTVRVNVNKGIACLREALEADDPKALDAARKNVAKLCPAGGPLVLCNDDGTSQVVDDDAHTITFATTGKGKTRRFVYPSIYSDILAGTNIVVNDMKGEIYDTTKTMLAAMGYTTYVLDLRNPAKSPSRYNPLGVAWDAWHEGRRDDAFMSLRSFALCIFSSNATDEPFWPNSATDYFTGIAIALLEMGVTREEFTLENISLIDREGENNAIPALIQDKSLVRKDMDLTWSKLFMMQLGDDSLARRFLVGTINAPHNTKTSILAIFRQPISIFVGHNGLMNAISTNDFTSESLTHEKTAVFVISPDETHVFGSVVVSVLNQLMSGLITIAQSAHGGVLPRRVDFFLDEMGNLPAPIPDMEALVSAARSRNMRFHFVLQSSDQLSSVYGDKLAQVILDNCSTWVYMGTRSLDFLETLSKLCGTVEMQSGQTRRLMPVDVLQHLATRETETETLVLHGSLKPYVTPLLDIGLYEHAPQERDEWKLVPAPAAERPAYAFRGLIEELVAMYERRLKEEADAKEEERKELMDIVARAQARERRAQDREKRAQERELRAQEQAKEQAQGQKPPSSAPIRPADEDDSSLATQDVEIATKTGRYALMSWRPWTRGSHLMVGIFCRVADEELAMSARERLVQGGVGTVVRAHKNVAQFMDQLPNYKQELLNAIVALADEGGNVIGRQWLENSSQARDIPLFIVLPPGAVLQTEVGENVEVIETGHALDGPYLAEHLISAFLRDDTLAEAMVDCALTIIEGGAGDHDAIYNAVNVVYRGRERLNRDQRMQVERICRNYRDHGLTYRQSMFLLSIAHDER